MRKIIILSPHLDDAAFSMCLCLLRWSQAGIRVHVVNVFTQSAYAPRAGTEEIEAITRLREKEDGAALRQINVAISVESLNFVDAPIRLGIESKLVCSEAAHRISDDSTIEQLRETLARTGRRAFVFAPLALGDHVDHLAVRSAAMAIRNEFRGLAFYEDLPYAIWTSERMLEDRVHDTENKTGLRLRPVIVRAEHAFWTKSGIVSQYRSQITRDDAHGIARYGNRYRGGERFWVPKPAHLGCFP